jgi:hypothetical protein
MAGLLILALAMHVLMLAGAAVGGDVHPHPDGSHAVAASPLVQAPGSAADGHGHRLHLGHQHLLVDCMKLMAVLAVAGMLFTDRRPNAAGQPFASPGLRSPRRQASELGPPGPLVARSVLLRI